MLSTSLRGCLPLLFAVALLADAGPSSAGDWSQWRGPTRDGRVESLPPSLEELTKAWSVELPPSYSGPVADASRVYTTATEDKANEVVIAYDLATGGEVWRASWPGAMSVPFFARANGSWIRATPALAGGRLYVAGMRDVLVCLDAATGGEIWRRDLAAERGGDVPMFGNVSSPLVRDGLVYIHDAGGISALDAATGQTRWTALQDGEGERTDGAFSSPTIDEDAPGGPQLLVQTRSTLAGLDPASGDVLWSTPVEAFRGMNILTPTARTVGDELQVFTSTYGGGSTMFTVGGGRGDVQTKWTNKSEAYMASPVVVDDRIVLPLRNQRVTAVDWNTGQTAWTSTPYGKYWSMLTDGDTVLALDQRGQLHRLGVGGESLDVRESREVSGTETWAHLGWDGERLLIRRLDGLDVYTAE